jgi:catechol-2,3-dioxygenase
VSEPIHPEVRIGHAHLRVADLERATAFYRDVLGFDVIAYGPDVDMSGMVFLSAGGYHHHIALNTRDSAGGTPPPEGHTGLHHIAILYPNRRELAKRQSSVCSTTATRSPMPTRALRARLYTSRTRTATGWSSTTMAPASSGPTRKASRSWT